MAEKTGVLFIDFYSVFILLGVSYLQGLLFHLIFAAHNGLSCFDNAVHGIFVSHNIHGKSLQNRRRENQQVSEKRGREKKKGEEKDRESVFQIHQLHADHTQLRLTLIYCLLVCACSGAGGMREETRRSATQRSAARHVRLTFCAWS